MSATGSPASGIPVGGSSHHSDECACPRCTGYQPGNKFGIETRFEAANDVARKHGSYVSRLRLAEDERTRELAQAIRETQPVAHPADEGTIARLALVYVRLERSKAALDRADEALAENPLSLYRDETSWLSRLRDDHARWHREAGRIEAELGRSPASRARLGLHIASARKAITLADLHEAAALEAQAVEEDES